MQHTCGFYQTVIYVDIHNNQRTNLQCFFLYTLYTNSCRSAYSNNHYFKYADDTALVGLLSDDETDYRSYIGNFMSLCMANCFELNVVRSKELVTDFRSGVHHPIPVNINGQRI